MLDTIIVGILILSALVYGFWQYFARPADARDKRKSKHSDGPRGPATSPCGAFWRISGEWKKKKMWIIKRRSTFSPRPTLTDMPFSFSLDLEVKNGSKRRRKKMCFRLPSVIHDLGDSHFLPFYYTMNTTKFVKHDAIWREIFVQMNEYDKQGGSSNENLKISFQIFLKNP